MSQSRKMSLAESITSSVSGFLIAVGCMQLLFYVMGIPVRTDQNVRIVVIMSFVSIIRCYLIRRFFSWLDRVDWRALVLKLRQDK